MTPGDRLLQDMELPHAHRILEKVNASGCLPSCAPFWGGTCPSVPCRPCSGRSGTKSLVLVAELCERSLGLSQNHRPEHPAPSGPAASACLRDAPNQTSLEEQRLRNQRPGKSAHMGNPKARLGRSSVGRVCLVPRALMPSDGFSLGHGVALFQGGPLPPGRNQ